MLFRSRLVKDQTTLTSSQFEIKQYTKPAYKIAITTDKKALFGWEKINYDIQTSFYEGTPVAGAKLIYSQDYKTEGEKDLLSDENGHSTLTLDPPVDTDNSWEPKNFNLFVHNATAEEQEVTSSSDVLVYPRDTMVEIDAVKANNKASVEITSNLIDFKKIKNENQYYDKEQYRGATVDIPLTAEISEKHWEAKEIATHYDFINKTTSKEYEYIEVNTIVQKLDFSTLQGKYAFNFPVEKDKIYSITLIGKDTKQNLIKETRSFYFDYQDSRYAPRKGYSLKNSAPQDSYVPGDKISLSTVPNSSDVKMNEKARCLYLTLKNGLKDYTVVTGNTYSFEFSKDNIPNLYVASVFFDGINIFTGGMENFIYDQKESALALDITSDKKEYKPGETVHVKINAKDPQGNPAVAAINLSVVDEAFFALQDQTVDILGSLYNYNLPSGMVTYFVSYTPIDPNSRNAMAEEGGEGGDSPSIRYKFKDTAFFGSTVTDKNGNAELSFTVPDNLTSWRLTYQGLTEDMKAGNGRLNISTKLPFFADVIFNTIFMTGDLPYLTARAFGTELKSTGKVDYTVLLDNKKGDKKSYAMSSQAGAFARIPLEKLEKGDYSVTVTAKYGEFSDAIKKDFRVVDNLLEASRLKFYSLSKDLKPEGGDSLTSLTFYNKNSSLMYNTLSTLIYSFGDRIDQKVARKTALDLMKKYYPGDEALKYFSEEETPDFGSYQINDGGIALLSYDSSNPILSAKVCSVAKDSFDQGALKAYFYGILDNKDSTLEDITASYWGLASLGEPVLLDIQNLLKSPDLGLKEKLFLGLGLSELGDRDSATALYTGIITGNSTKEAPYLYIDSKTTRDATLELTSLASVLAMKVNADEKLSLYNYVIK